MNKRKWFYALPLALPLILAIPLYLASSWRPHAFGAHPFPIMVKNRGFVSGSVAIPALSPDLMMAVNVSN